MSTSPESAGAFAEARLCSIRDRLRAALLKGSGQEPSDGTADELVDQVEAVLESQQQSILDLEAERAEYLKAGAEYRAKAEVEPDRLREELREAYASRQKAIDRRRGAEALVAQQHQHLADVAGMGRFAFTFEECVAALVERLERATSDLRMKELEMRTAEARGLSNKVRIEDLPAESPLAHDGPGWYWYFVEADGRPMSGSDGGVVGVFSTRGEATASALRNECEVSADDRHHMLGEFEKRLRTTDARVVELEALINTPRTADWFEAVRLEAAHQVERFGTTSDEGKGASDWFWLIGWLAGKAVHAAIAGNLDKALHHTVSTAAVCLNWHRHLTGENSRLRPGISPPDGSE